MGQFLLAQGISDPYAHHKSDHMDGLVSTARSMTVHSSEWFCDTFIDFFS